LKYSIALTATQKQERMMFNIMKAKGYLKATLLMMLMCAPFAAEAGGLAAATNGLTSFLSQLQPIIRIVAVLAIIGAGVGYMMNFVDKSLFVKIISGLIVVASANELVNFFYAGNVSASSGN
jgi:type IV secretory pathway VirB2 component (pilin)